MYARNNGDTELTFGVSGRLWRENLIMYDRQTDSWWAQAYGRAVQGPMKDTELEMYPSTMMTWKVSSNATGFYLAVLSVNGISEVKRVLIVNRQK